MKKDNNDSTIIRQSLQNRITHWGIALSTFSLIISWIFQLPIAKRYMINELPLLAWSADYHISLVMHYVGGGVFLGIFCCVSFVFSYSKKRI